MYSLLVMWPCSFTVGQGMLCSRKISVLGEGLSKLRGSLFFLKADSCQWEDPHTLWSSTVLISTELFCLMGVKNLVPSVCASLLLMQLSPLCLGKVPLSLPLLPLWLSNPTMHCLSPLFFWRLPLLTWRAVCGSVLLLVWALVPWAWQQRQHSSTAFAAALLSAVEPQGLACPA